MMTAITAWALDLGIAAALAGGVDWREVPGYYRCEGAAHGGGLGAGGVAACGALYARVKLSVVGLDEERLRALPRDARAEANRRAFRALRAWEAANPALVARLKAEGARG